jgi:hypothetical protein
LRTCQTPSQIRAPPFHGWRPFPNHEALSSRELEREFVERERHKNARPHIASQSLISPSYNPTHQMKYISHLKSGEENALSGKRGTKVLLFLHLKLRHRPDSSRSSLDLLN